MSFSEFNKVLHDTCLSWIFYLYCICVDRGFKVCGLAPSPSQGQFSMQIKYQTEKVNNTTSSVRKSINWVCTMIFF